MHIKCYTHWPVWLPQLLLSLACWHRLAVAHLSPCPSDSLILLSPHTRQTAAQEEKEKLTTKNRIIQYTGLWEVLALSRTFLNDFNPQLLDIHFPTIHPVTFHLLLPHIHKRKEKLETLFPFFSVGVFVKTPTDVHHQNIKPCLIRTEIPCKPLRGLQHCENC